VSIAADSLIHGVPNFAGTYPLAAKALHEKARHGFPSGRKS
jgi:hypothetical protein